MRGRMSDAPSYAKPVGVDEVMEGGTVNEVVASNNDKYAVGDIVLAIPAGRPMRCRKASACASSIRASRRSRPRLACSACPA